MEVKIDTQLFDFLSSSGFDVSECLIYLFAAKYGLKAKISEEAFRFLQESSLIHFDFVKNRICISSGLFEGEQIILPVFNPSFEKEIRDRVDEYRSLFKGIRSGSIGVKSKVADLLVKFCLAHHKTIDEVIKTTEIYMSYTDTKMISNADNFIQKLDKDGNEVSLLLLAFEEQDMHSITEQRTYKVL